MPAFFVVAGVLVKGSVKRHRCGEFLSAKAQTIACPYLVWSVIQTLLQTVFHSQANDPTSPLALFTIAYKPVAQFCFLYALLMVISVYKLLRDRNLSTTACLLIASVVYLFSRDTFWSWEVLYGAAGYGIFFAVGACMKVGVPKWCATTWRLGALTIASVAGVSVAVTNGWKSLLLGRLAVGLLGTFGVFSLAMLIGRRGKPIFTQVIGKQSLAIFVAHTIFAAGFRVVLAKLGQTDLVMHVVGGVLAGVLGPLCLVFL